MKTVRCKETCPGSNEDYLEVILAQLEHDDHAHAVDIAKAMGVTKPSVTKALKNLSGLGLVDKENYGAVTLTAAGRARAEAVQKKHKAVRALLTDILAVSPACAEEDACKIEHCISDETAQRLFEFLAARGLI